MHPSVTSNPLGRGGEPSRRLPPSDPPVRARQCLEHLRFMANFKLKTRHWLITPERAR